MVEYYRPSDIRYLRDDVIWMISVVLTLEAGEWPSEPIDTGYVGGKATSHCAPFQTPGDVRAEVEERIKLTKSDGETLVWEITHGTDYYDFLCPAAKSALNYISSGPKRRKETYSEWLRNRKTKKVIQRIGNLVNITTSKCGKT